MSKLVFFSAFLIFAFSGCGKTASVYEPAGEEDRIIIWTDNSEFAPYIELFNKTHEKKAVLVYKENPSSSFPVSEDDSQPDLVIGSWLMNEQTKRYFESLDYLFERKFISSENFYSALLDAGKIKRRQYLIPVSFNLPLMIFSKENENFVEDSYTITLEQIRKSGESFNRKNRNGSFSAMGFAPESSDDFLYLVTKIQGADYKEAKGNTFSWDSASLSKSIDFLSDWINEANGSSKTESDFVYKYLSVTDEKRVAQGKTLFAYTTSDKLFKLASQQFASIDYRWFRYENSLPVEDSMVMLGLPKKAKNHNGAAVFISWFFEARTQSELLERKFSMSLDTNRFGIANGFSAVREVTEHILPVYYTSLLSNIPQAETFRVYGRKPLRWERTKRRVIIPFIKESIASDGTKRIQTIEERYAEWRKQGFN